MAQTIVESFETSDITGWDATGTVTGFMRMPTGGVGDSGFLQAQDNGAGTWYFRYDGTVEEPNAYYNGALSFFLKQNQAASQVDSIDIFLVGGGNTLYVDWPLADNPGTGWTQYTVALNPTAGWTHAGSDLPASAGELLTTLTDFDALEIAGEFADGPDTGGLDEVVLAPFPDPPTPYFYDFATGPEGWRVANDAQPPVWVPTGGARNGYLQATDTVGGDVWYFKTPEDFPSDLSQFLGGTIEYQLTQSQTNNQFDDFDVILTGAGRSLAGGFGPSNTPPTDWTLRYYFELNAEYGLTDLDTGLPVDNDDLLAVLGDLDSIEIRGEYRTGPDTGGLDVVAINPAGWESGGITDQGGPSPDTLFGGPRNDTLLGEGNNDQLYPDRGNDFVDGGPGGGDAVYIDFAIDEHSLVFHPGGTVFVSDHYKNGNGVDQLINVERIEFDLFQDGSGAPHAPAYPNGVIDLTALTGIFDVTEEQIVQFVEMYIAYFDRAPAAQGLMYWCTRLAEGMPLEQIAKSFFVQPESRALYPEDLDNGQLVSAVFNNLLGRDPAGPYWENALNAGDVDRPAFMLAVIKGAKANPDAVADVRTVTDKADLGIYSAIFKGLTDYDMTVGGLALYDPADPATSKLAARDQIDDFAELAMSTGDDGTLTMQVVGVIEDPFAV